MIDLPPKPAGDGAASSAGADWILAYERHVTLGERAPGELPADISEAERQRLLDAKRAIDSLQIAFSDRFGASQPDAPREIGDFRIIREIGRGGMGIVYEAEQLSLGRRVALKVLPFAAMLSEQQLKRFKNEARAAATLKHPHIVNVFSVGVERGVYYYAMELIEGLSLDRIFERFRSHDSPCDITKSDKIETLAKAILSTKDSTESFDYFRRIAQLGVEVSEALAHAHQQGIIHRDIKPANLLLDTSGKVWIADFGLARLDADAGLTRTGDFVGTLRYMSPEQALAEPAALDHRTDIYSLGITLYEFATLTPAYPETDRKELLRKIAFDQPVRPREVRRDIPIDLETIICKAIEKEPIDRYRTAKEMAEDLQRFVSHKPITARRAGPLERIGKWSRRNVALVWLVVALTFAGAIVLAVSTLFIAHSHSVMKTALEQATVDQERLAEALYAADVVQAAQAWKNDDMSRAVDVLDQHIPTFGAKDRRGIEWFFLRRRCTEKHTEISAVDAAIYDFAFSPDGGRLAAVGKDSVLRIYDWKTPRLLQRTDTEQGEINAVAFDSRGTILTAGDDGRIVQLAANSLKFERAINAHKGPVFGIAFITPTNSIVSCGEDGAVRIWDAVKGTPAGDLAGHSAAITYLVPFDDGNAVATAGRDRAIRLWDLASKKLLRRFRQSDRARAFAMMDDDAILIVAEESGQIYLIDLAKTVGHLVMPQLRRIDSVAISPDNQILVAGADDGAIWMWRRMKLNGLAGMPQFGLLRTWKAHTGTIYRLSFAPESNDLISAGEDGRILRWNTPAERNAEIYHAALGSVKAIASTLTQRAVAVIGSDGIGLADPRTGEVTEVISDEPVDWGYIDISADGRCVAAGAKNRVSMWVRDERGWRGLVQWTPSDGIWNVSLSPNGSTLAVYGRDNDDGVVLVDTKTRLKRSGFVRHGGNCVVWSPDARYFAVSENHTNDVRLFSASTEKLLQRFRRHETSTSALAFSPDSRLLASGDDDGFLAVWDIELGAEVWSGTATSQLNTRSGLDAVAFAPNGRTVLTLNQKGVIAAWHVATGRLLFQIDDLVGSAECLALSDNGQFLCTVRSGRLSVFETGLPAHGSTAEDYHSLRRPK